MNLLKLIFQLPFFLVFPVCIKTLEIDLMDILQKKKYS